MNNPDSKIDPIDVQKAAVLLAGISGGEVRESLRSFYNSNVATPSPVAISTVDPAPPSIPVAPDFTDSLNIPPPPLDSGVPIVSQFPNGKGGSASVQVVVTGVLNGVAASGLAAFFEDPVPL